MHFQFLIEDLSGQTLVDTLMKKVQEECDKVTYNIKSFRGIGGFTKKNTVKEIKTGKLLNDLATYLRGFNKSLLAIEAAVIVVVDNDDRDTIAFRDELESVAVDNNILIDHVFCVAVEEIEAWLLGDEEAVMKAYPKGKQTLLHTYKQDSICGTWEILADVVYPGGCQKLKKDCPSYYEIGKIKSEWARSIGQYMNLHKNKSNSFEYFIGEINRRAITVA